MTENANRLRLASYNIHGWRGADGVHDPLRIMRVVASLNADVVALQEVVSPRLAGAHCSLTEMGEALGYHVTFGETMLRSDSRYGNAVLSRWEPVEYRPYDLSCERREPRGAIDLQFEVNDLPLRIVATHLGLRFRERACQVAALTSLLNRDGKGITVLMGDFNDWLPFSRVRRKLRQLLGPCPMRATFPARFPFLPLDRAYVSPSSTLISVTSYRGEDAAQASDHLPLVADLVLDAL